MVKNFKRALDTIIGRKGQPAPKSIIRHYLCFHFSMLSWKFRYKAIKMVNILSTYCVLRILYVKNLQLNEETTKQSVVYLKGKEIQ